MLTSPRGLYSTQKTLQSAIDDLIVARFPSAKELRDNADVVAELLRDSIEAFALRIGLSANRFHEAYSSAVRITLATLDKPALRGVCRFQSLPVRAALRWLKSRLLNNVRTVLTDPNSAEWLGHLDNEYVETVTIGNAETEAEFAGITREQAIYGLSERFKDGADIGELDAVLSTVGTESADGSTSTVGTHSAGPESAGPQGTAIKEEFKKEEFKKEKNTPLPPQGEVGGRINRKKTLNIAEIGDIHGFTTSTIEDYLNFRLNSGGIDNAEAFEKHLLRELSSFTSPESNKLENWFTAWEDEQPAIKALAGEFLSIPAHWFDRRACRERGRDAFDNGWVKLEGYYVEIPGRGQEEIQAIVIEIAYQLAHEQRREDRVGFVDACRRVNQERLTEGVA